MVPTVIRGCSGVARQSRIGRAHTWRGLPRAYPAFRQSGCRGLCGHHRRAALGRAADRSTRLPDRRHRPGPGRSRRDAERQGFRKVRNRGHRSMEPRRSRADECGETRQRSGHSLGLRGLKCPNCRQHPLRFRPQGAGPLRRPLLFWALPCPGGRIDGSGRKASCAVTLCFPDAGSGTQERPPRHCSTPPRRGKVSPRPLRRV